MLNRSSTTKEVQISSKVQAFKRLATKKFIFQTVKNSAITTDTYGMSKHWPELDDKQRSEFIQAGYMLRRSLVSAWEQSESAKKPISNRSKSDDEALKW